MHQVYYYYYYYYHYHYHYYYYYCKGTSGFLYIIRSNTMVLVF